MTNTNEGNLFVNQTDVFMDASTYAGQLFPKLGSKQKKRSTEAILWFGDYSQPTILICPSFYMLNAFREHGFNTFKAASTNSRSSVIPPAMHGMDISYYFPSTSPITFQNPRFSAAFSQSFLSFVISLDPHNKINPREDITPSWPMYPIADIGMVFNKTAVGNRNDVHPVQVDDGVLQRCSFRESLGALTGQ
ncbi:hypothetical protein C8J55DRAFT_586279 [Lentinula edodes]|uniref:Alpha/beta-hydrolase n=1 Tax=Lentinula lateritia TaxID=40482 RepID=A0A9W9AY83_9AGAR|nr:hypothetical protein C8J55DRAFT_586279 [Lentinula edodes]